MPIYAYRCESCGFEKDVLQKISDPHLTKCPQCGKDTFRKQLTAAGFQLKGSGWYETDFRGSHDGPAKHASSTQPAASPACANCPARAEAGASSPSSSSSS